MHKDELNQSSEKYHTNVYHRRIVSKLKISFREMVTVFVLCAVPVKKFSIIFSSIASSELIYGPMCFNG